MSLTLLEKIDSCYLTQSGSLLPSPADLADRCMNRHLIVY